MREGFPNVVIQMLCHIRNICLTSTWVRLNSCVYLIKDKMSAGLLGLFNLKKKKKFVLQLYVIPMFFFPLFLLIQESRS